MTLRTLPGAAVRTLRGIAAAIARGRRIFWGVTAAVLVFDLVGPVAILALSRRPPDFFTFNPWLSRLPDYLRSDGPLWQKLSFLSSMAVAWVSADNGGEGVDWGVVYDVPMLSRALLTALVFGTYFALWSHRRRQGLASGLGQRAARPAGVAGAVTSVLGLTTGPCSLAGCGVPVLPVAGLAFTGLSSGTLVLLTALSRVSIAVVLSAMALAVLWLGWRTGPAPAASAAPTS
jgi:hypothetical protein